MKRILTPLLSLVIALFALSQASTASAAENTTLQATLIHGSNDGGGVDGSLKAYEKILKRVLRFDTFKQQGSGSVSVATPGTGKVGLSGGHTANFEVQDAGSGKLRIAARWTNGGKTYLNTTVVTAKGQPTALVGPSEGSGKLILLLVAK